MAKKLPLSLTSMPFPVAKAKPDKVEKKFPDSKFPPKSKRRVKKPSEFSLDKGMPEAKESKAMKAKEKRFGY